MPGVILSAGLYSLFTDVTEVPFKATYGFLFSLALLTELIVGAAISCRK